MGECIKTPLQGSWSMGEYIFEEDWEYGRESEEYGRKYLPLFSPENPRLVKPVDRWLPNWATFSGEGA